MPPRGTATLTFEDLWRNYPNDPPCVGDGGSPPPGWDNQCAVRLGVALERSGVSFKTFKGGRCPTGPRGGGMVASAQSLATWLRARPFVGCPAVQIVHAPTWKIAVTGRTGIVFFQDYWRRRGEGSGNGSGDHIDLWNRDSLTPSWASFMRFTLGIDRLPNLNPFTRSDDNQNVYSDLGRSSSVLFWPIP